MNRKPSSAHTLLFAGLRVFDPKTIQKLALNLEGV